MLEHHPQRFEHHDSIKECEVDQEPAIFRRRDNLIIHQIETRDGMIRLLVRTEGMLAINNEV